MAVFTNQATLSYNGNTVNSNVVTGEVVEALTVTKTAIDDTYTQGERLTYAVSIINTGTTSYTNLTLTDNLGEIPFGAGTVTPLSFVPDSVLFYVNGVLAATPTVANTAPLTFTGLNIPAGANALIIYQADVNGFAPVGADAEITNTVSVTGGGLQEAVTADETVTSDNAARLNITKSLSPAVVNDNGEITYTFLIENFGTTAVTAADNASVTDTFNPVLSNIVVTFDGATWTAPANYTYNEATGVFTTVPGQITVPAATANQDAATGEFVVTPGTAVLQVRGTV